MAGIEQARDSVCEARAKQAAKFLRERLTFDGADAALVLGTGWGDVIRLERAATVPFNEIPGFEHLREIDGHARQVEYGTVAGKKVIALRGRVHVNETPVGGFTLRNVRLQIEMLLQLGVNKLILTCAAGGLAGRAETGSVVIIDGILSINGPTMPLFGGEFCSPEDTLDSGLMGLAFLCGEDGDDHFVDMGGLAMVRGPFFEGTKYDKQAIAATGVSCVGMSVLPECCVAALYPGTKVLALAFISNDDQEAHSHEENRDRAKKASARLGGYIHRIVEQL